MELSIIIPTKDRIEILTASLKALRQAVSHIDCEVIVVNDSSTSKPNIPLGFKKISVVNNPKSGVASARNFGASLALSQILLFMDDDIQVSKDVIDRTIEFYKNNSNACFNPDWHYPSVLIDRLQSTAFGRFMIAYHLTSFKGWYNGLDWREGEIFPVQLLASFYLPITRDQFCRSGGYNEDFPHAGFEDYDFPVRLRKVGVRFFIDTRVSVFHNEEDRSDLRNWLGRQIRGAQTRKIGVGLGYQQLGIEYSYFKRFVYSAVFFFKTPLIRAVTAFPNVQAFDFIKFRLILFLQAASIFEGYNKIKH
jgi:GT2 family glycosyltransferase